MAKITKQYTKNYDMFVFREDNRDISMPNVKSIVGSIERNGFLQSQAVIVKAIPGSSKVEVFDGQHRVLAAKEAGSIVWYEFDEDMPETALADIQIAQRWLPKDHLKHFVANKVKGYDRLKELSDAHSKVAIMTIVLLLLGAKHQDKYQDNFKAGELKITHLNETIQTLQKVEALNVLYPRSWLFGRTFLAAYMKILEIPGYSHKRFLEKVAYQSEKFIQMMSEKGYFEMIGKIYNYKSLEENRIKFEYDVSD